MGTDIGRYRCYFSSSFLSDPEGRWAFDQDRYRCSPSFNDLSDPELEKVNEPFMGANTGVPSRPTWGQIQVFPLVQHGGKYRCSLSCNFLSDPVTVY